MDAIDPMVYSARWRVRSYEIDGNGHVNNAVYVSYAEALTTEHAALAGFGREWAERMGGAWVVHKNVATYHAPALLGDELELTVRVLLVRGARGIRRTTITRPADRAAIAEILTEWVWIKSDGRPAVVPEELVAMAALVTHQTLAERPSLVRELARL